MSTNKVKRVLVMWAEDESPNLGVRALARGVRDGVPADWDVTYASHRTPLASGALSLKKLLAAAAIPKHPLRDELSGYDLVIDVGEGDSFASIYGAKRFGKLLASKAACKAAGVPYILAPQTLGPWEGRIATQLASLAMSRATSVWARDSLSHERATAAGVNGARTASDLVFSMDVPKTTRARSHDLLLNVSGLLWNSNRHVDHVKYREFIHALFVLAQERGVSMALLPHVLAPGTGDDDLLLSQELAARYSVDVVDAPSLQNVRQEIASAQLVVGSRMHACLNALSVGTPALALGYSDKFGPLFTDLDYGNVIDMRREQPDPASVLAMMGTAELRTKTEAARSKGRAGIRSFFDSLDVP